MVKEILEEAGLRPLGRAQLPAFEVRAVVSRFVSPPPPPPPPPLSAALNLYTLAGGRVKEGRSIYAAPRRESAASLHLPPCFGIEETYLAAIADRRCRHFFCRCS